MPQLSAAALTAGECPITGASHQHLQSTGLTAQSQLYNMLEDGRRSWARPHRIREGPALTNADALLPRSSQRAEKSSLLGIQKTLDQLLTRSPSNTPYWPIPANFCSEPAPRMPTELN